MICRRERTQFVFKCVCSRREGGTHSQSGRIPYDLQTRTNAVRFSNASAPVMYILRKNSGIVYDAIYGAVIFCAVAQFFRAAQTR